MNRMAERNKKIAESIIRTDDRFPPVNNIEM